ncbi:O-methyltransferase domain containing protein [Burkholderiaceae bacterium]
MPQFERVSQETDSSNRSLSESFADWRNSVIASPRFQRWAARFPLTRWIVRKQATSLFDVMAGFVYSQILLACVRVHLFELLAHGALSKADLQKQIALPESGLSRLLDAAVSIRLLSKRKNGHYALGMLGAPLVGNRALLDMIVHHGDFYRDLQDPLALLRGDGAGKAAMAEYWPYINGEKDPSPESLSAQRVADYSQLMAHTQPLVTAEVIDSYSFAKHRHLLDIGGGQGAFVSQLVALYPQLTCTLFDLPGVAELANAYIEKSGLSNKINALGGNFFQGELPKGADVATLIRVIFDHDDGRVAILLRNVFNALEPGASLILAEPMAGTPGQEAMGDAYFGFYLLAMGRGRPRTQGEISQMLQEAGFESITLLPSAIPLNAQILHCKKPMFSVA